MKYTTAKANDSRLRDMRKSLRNNATPAEATLWRALRGRAAGGFKFRRQQSIGNYVLDFYCPELLLCVELDGSSHDYKFDYDEQRSSYLLQQGIRVARFRNELVWKDLDGVVNEIVRIGREIEEKRGGGERLPSLVGEGSGVGSLTLTTRR